MKKVLFCDNSLREFINFRGEVANSYLNGAVSVVIVAPENAPVEKLKGVKLYPVLLNRSGMNPFKDFKLFISYLNIYRRERPDYVFHYTIKPNIYGTLAAAMLGIPSTAMIAGLGYVFTNKGLGSRIARILYRFSMRFPENVLVLNEYNRQLLIQKKIVQERKLILLHGGEGVNLDKFKI